MVQTGDAPCFLLDSSRYYFLTWLLSIRFAINNGAALLPIEYQDDCRKNKRFSLTQMQSRRTFVKLIFKLLVLAVAITVLFQTEAHAMERHSKYHIAAHYKATKNAIANFTSKGFVYSLRLLGVGGIVAHSMTPYDGIQEDQTFGRHNYQSQDWGTPIKVMCLDGIELAGYWAQKTESGPTMILFHGNAMVSRDLEEWAEWFQAQDYNVLAVTMRGYPGSEGSSRLIRIASALDIEAVVRYAREELNIPHHNLALYGYSLGGTYATYAARHFHLPAILQNTLTTTGDVIENKARMSIPNWAKNAIARSHLERGKKMYSLPRLGLFSDEHTNVPLNSMDNLKNLAETKSEVMIIYAENDVLMGGKKRAKKLYQARYGRQDKIDRNLFVKISHGNHKSIFLHDAQARDAVQKFLWQVFAKSS